MLKLYAWEPYFERQIKEIRHQELINLRTITLLGAITFTLWFSSSFIVGSFIQMIQFDMVGRQILRLYSISVLCSLPPGVSGVFCDVFSQFVRTRPRREEGVRLTQSHQRHELPTGTYSPNGHYSRTGEINTEED